MKNKNNKNKYLSIDLYNGKSKWISQKDFLTFTIGDKYDGKDSRGYYYEYKLDDGTIEKEHYNWRDNFEDIKKTPTHTIYKSEECMLIDFTNYNFGGVWLREAK